MLHGKAFDVAGKLGRVGDHPVRAGEVAWKGLSMSEIGVDFALLGSAQRRLEDAGANLDDLGSQMPSRGDYGAAGPLIELGLAVQAEASARLAAEAAMLGFAVGLCATDLGYTDAQQAVDIITIGNGT